VCCRRSQSLFAVFALTGCLESYRAGQDSRCSRGRTPEYRLLWRGIRRRPPRRARIGMALATIQLIHRALIPGGLRTCVQRNVDGL